MLAALARPRYAASVTWTPVDERWYRMIDAGSRSDAGVVVLPENALRIAVVYRAVNVLAHSVASIPLVVYQRLANDGKERARSHPAFDLLHDRPNRWTTSFRWRHLMMVQAALWGDHYSELLPGPGGIGQIVPLNPDTTRLVDQLRDGRLLYVTRDVSDRGLAPERRLLQDEILHVRGFSLDGKRGIPLTRMACNAMGLALAAERHGSMFMRRGAQFSGFLSTEQTMDEEARKAEERAWQRARGGPEASGTTPILSGGMKYEKLSSTNKDSQWIESRTFQVEELLRYLGVPGVLCGYADKTATYASAEQFFMSFVTHTVRPWTENIAQELNAAVIVEAPEYYADFILEGLLRGDIKTRYEAYNIGISAGFLSRNEVRVKEDLNRGPTALDGFLEPLNMATAGSRGTSQQNQPARSATPDDDDVDDEEEDENEARASRLAAIAERAVQRLVRRELVAIAGSSSKRGAAKRFAGDAQGWAAWLDQFYGEHAELLASDLGIDAARATQYCAGQRARLTTGIPGDFEPASLTAMLALLED